MSAEIEAKLKDLEASLEQVTKQHNDAVQFIAQLKEKALTINGAILAYRDIDGPVAEEAPVEEAEEEAAEPTPCETGNCPV